MTDSLFLPFTPEGRAKELQAIKVKDHLGLSVYDSVDPYAVLDRVPARLVSPNCLDSCSAGARGVLLASEADMWSAVCFGRVGCNGEALILVNPTHHPHRQRVSLMEEIVHVVLDHPPTKLEFNGNGRWERPFDAEVESEAYSVGAACILPYRTLFRWVKEERADVGAIAARTNVSTQYAQFRVRDAGLYRVYQKAQRSS